MITSKQVKAARALLGWRQSDLARESGLHINVVNTYERGAAGVRATTRDAIQRALESHGIEFIEGGVRIKDR